MSEIAELKAARDRLSRVGITAAELARELGVSNHVVTSVLSGRIKGIRGDAHKVAVALGLKDGVIRREGMSITEALKAQAA